MSALAMVALRRGVAVTGSDRSPDGAPDLPGLGATVLQGHDPRLVEGARAVVVSAAIPPDHPEIVRAKELGIPIVSRKAALGALVAGGGGGGLTVGVAGTHGKTTTTVMTTEALAAGGFDPTGLAGGRVENWGGNARIGGDRLFVVEADEFDQAFLELDPAVAVVTNVEPEHLECYDGSVERMEEAFAEFAGRAETVLIGTADAGSDRVARRLATRESRRATRVWRYGPGAGDLAVTATRSEVERSEARVRLPDAREVSLRLRVPGRHNLANATAALGVVLALGGAVEPALVALERFTGVGRRFERLGESGGVAVVDDYAHHPTEIAATLEATRQAFPGRRVVAVFQPHLYSRTGALAREMGTALVGADLVWVTEVYAAREAPIPGVSGRLVADAAVAGGAVAWFEGDRARLSERVLDMLRPGDVVLTLGAGDITTLGPVVLQALGGGAGER